MYPRPANRASLIYPNLPLALILIGDLFWKFQWPGVDGDAERPTNKKHKEDRKEEKVKKKKKKKKKKKADNTETRKRKRCSSRDSATDGSQ